MKKSMIISTIAMIVVVVVALSTATYAWFSTSRQAVATTTITTQSTTDWTIQKSTISSGVATFESATENIEMQTTLMNGLIAPNTGAIISAQPEDNNGGQTNVLNSAKWLQGNNETAAGFKATVVNEGNAVDPTIIRVINTKDGDKALTLTVYVKLGATPTEATKYAASNLCFYVADGSGNTFTNGYTYLTTQLNSAGDVVYSSNAKQTADPTVSITGTKPNYAGSDGSLWSRVDSDAQPEVTNVGMSVGDLYIKYTIGLGTITLNQGINLAIYTWLDGFALKDNAAGASLNVYYAFSGSV